MKRKNALIILLALICVVCAAFAFGCSQSKTYYTVTFMNVQTQVGEPLKVERGKRITQFPYVAPETVYDFLDGWCMDEELSKPWDEKVERVTKDVTLYAKFLHITEVPNNPFMGGEAFSNTLYWLQRGEAGANYSVELFVGEKISRTDYDYAEAASYAENNCTVTAVNYKGEPDIYLVSWTAAEKPAGGVYAAKVTCGEAQATFEKLLYKGAGTEENPYLIDSAADFAAISTADVPAGNYYKLLKNITVRSASSKVAGFTFDGILDGNGKTVTIEASDCGLFATLGENAKVYDLAVDGSIPGVSDNCAGVIASVNNGSILYCNVSATITGELGTIGELEILEKGITGGVGGIVGVNCGTVENCAFSGTVQASVGAGGIAAVNYGEIDNCTNGGTQGAGNANETGSSTKKYSYMGGIAAVNFGTISKSATTNSGKLLAQRSETGDSPNNNIGGIAAYNASGATITECWFDGIRVHGNKNVGGIAGENAGEISFCFAAGVYKSGSKLHSYIGGYCEVGGIVGLTSGGTVKNCFVTANVYAYGSTAYSIAGICENCIYISGNLDVKQTATLSAPQDNNLLIEITEEDRAAYTGKTYPLTLTEEQLAAFNGIELSEEGKFVSGKNGVELSCKDFETVKTHTVTVTVHPNGEVNVSVSNTGSETVALGKNNAPAAPEGQYLAGWALKDGGEIVFGTKAIGYVDLEELGLEIINLYPVYLEGEDPQDKVVNIAVYGKFISEELISGLTEAFKNSELFDGFEDPVYTMLSSKDNATFSTDVKNGDCNIAIGYKTGFTVTYSQRISVSIIDVDGKLDNRYVAILSNGSATDAFAQFLNTDAAKKIMNPDFIGEAEAQKIEVTLISDGAQYGEKLYVSNATEAAKVTLPTPEAPEQDYSFKGWKTDGGETFTGVITYDDIVNYGADGKLTLTAQFVNVPTIIIAYYTTSNYCTEDEATDIEAEFKEYLKTQTAYTEYSITLRAYSGDVATLVDSVILAGDVDIVLGGGNNIDTKAGTTTKQTLPIIGGKVAMPHKPSRNVVRLSAKALAVEFMNYVDWINAQ